MATRFSWARGKSYDGRRRMPNTYRLRYGGQILAVAQEANAGGWFWYGDSINTAHNTDTLDNVKAAAVKHFKAKQARDAVGGSHE